MSDSPRLSWVDVVVDIDNADANVWLKPKGAFTNQSRGPLNHMIQTVVFTRRTGIGNDLWKPLQRLKPGSHSHQLGKTLYTRTIPRLYTASVLQVQYL